jgi:hypothetical protein
MKYENLEFDWNWEFNDDRPESKAAQILQLTEGALRWMHTGETSNSEKWEVKCQAQVRRYLIELYRVQGLVYVVVNAAKNAATKA